MSNHDFEVEILVFGRPVKVFKHQGQFFVEGRRGSAYELKIYNNTWSRVEVVASVDGMSVMEDSPAGPQNSGYVIPARSSIIIPGFRRNNSAVAEFVFSDKRDSYANAMGAGTQNVGAIGFMFFKEKVAYTYTVVNQPFHQYPLGTSINTAIGVYSSNLISHNISSTSCNTGRSVGSTPDSFELGTDWGNEVQHNVREVQFSRENPSHPDKIIVVYYDSRRGLEARGIRVVESTVRPKYETPNPFPGYTEPGCNPPPGWTGRRR